MASSKMPNLSILRGNMVSYTDTSLSHLVTQTFSNQDLQSKPALYHNQTCLTFAELRDLVDSICCTVVFALDSSQLNKGESCIVALLIPPSFARIAAILALFELGVAYMPLDPTLPPMRVRTMLSETNTRLILASSHIQNPFLSVCSELDIPTMMCDLHTHPQVATDRMTAFIDDRQQAVDPIACILYTSGSTGTPKGVRLTGSNVFNRLQWYWRCFPFGEAEKCCHKTSLLFVDSLTEVFCAVFKGVPIEIIDRETVQNVEMFLTAIRSTNITRLVVVPSLLKAMLDIMEMADGRIRNLDNLKYITCSGEALSSELATRMLMEVKPGTTLLNLYGSTETTGDVTYEVVQCTEDIILKELKKCVCIGKPVDNCRVYFLDDQMRVVEHGTTGDMWVSGQNVACGYVGEEKKGAIEHFKSNFVSNMFSNEESHRTLYRTGDIGRIIDGCVYFEGRKDGQVKIRGQRVNLLEIENVIQQMDSVEMAVVLCCQLNNDPINPWSYGEKSPIAFVKMRRCEPATDSDVAMRIRLQCQLPSYMVPEIVKIKEFPIQPQTGKIDRQALREFFWQQLDPSESEHPNVASAEHVIIQMVAQELGRSSQNLDLEKSFFEHGGSSLGAVTIVTKLSRCNMHISLTSFLQVSSLRELVQISTNSLIHAPDICHKMKDVKISQLQNEVDNIYSIEPLHEAADKEDVIDIIARGFIEKNPLDVLVNTGKDAMVTLVQSIWKEVLEDEVSVFQECL